MAAGTIRRKSAKRPIIDQKDRCHGVVKGGQCPNDAMPGRQLCDECFDREKDQKASVKTTRRTSTPEHFLDAVNRLLNDPDIASHRENIALLDAMIQAQFEQITPPVELLQRASRNYHMLMAGGPESIAAGRKLGEILEQAQSEATRMREIVKLMNEQRRHIEAENRREAQAAAVVPAKQFMMFIDFMIALDRDTIPDEITRNQRIAAIAARFQLEVPDGPSELPARSTAQQPDDVIDAEFDDQTSDEELFLVE